MKPEKLEFHLGADYACVMRSGQTTDNPLAAIYGQSKDVVRFGRLFAGAPALIATLERIAQGGNKVHADLPPAKTMTRQEMADAAREVIEQMRAQQ